MEKFLNGISAKAPRPNAPEFVKGSISIKREELINTLSGMDDEWINLDLKESKGGNYYLQINTYKKEDQKPKEEFSVQYDAEVEKTDENEFGF